MTRRFLLAALLLFWAVLPGFSQEMKEEERLPKGQFTFAPGAALGYRSFEKGTFLGDTYAVGLSYRLHIDVEFHGYPGVGIYFDKQAASMLDNRFLGGFFTEVRMPETGVYLYHQVPVAKNLDVRGELGYGELQVIHGLSPSRFILDYSNFHGGLAFNYNLAKEVNGVFDLNLIFGGNYSFLLGNDIVINAADRSYVQRATAIQGIFGIRILYL
ncbi:MAG: hypothetical protein NBV57_05070 [Algoriphagus sp.]|nr:hypothetical protein [Algoriphagus sp.]